MWIVNGKEGKWKWMKATFANLEHLCDPTSLIGPVDLTLWWGTWPTKACENEDFFFFFPNHEGRLGSILKSMPPWEQSQGKILFHSAPWLYLFYIYQYLLSCTSSCVHHSCGPFFWAYRSPYDQSNIADSIQPIN